MHRLSRKAVKSGLSVLKSYKESSFLLENPVNDVARSRFSSIAKGSNALNTRTAESAKRVVMESNWVSKIGFRANMMTKDISKAGGNRIRENGVSLVTPHQVNKYDIGHPMLPCFTRSLASSSASQSSGQTQQQQSKDISAFDVESPLTYNIPEKPVTFIEGASYSVFILAGIAFAAATVYFTFKQLVMQPKEYQVFGEALERVQNDSQIRSRIGTPIKGYGVESRNRHARRQIPHKIWTDEDGVERVTINFVIRGPHGHGKAICEMFKDKEDNKWKYTLLLVEIVKPSPVQIMLESYIPKFKL